MSVVGGFDPEAGLPRVCLSVLLVLGTNRGGDGAQVPYENVCYLHEEQGTRFVRVRLINGFNLREEPRRVFVKP